MAIGIESFRQARGDRLVLDRPSGQGPTGIKAERLFRSRTVWWRSGVDRDSHIRLREEHRNREFRTAFHQALMKAEGPTIARQAMRAAGLPPGWARTGRPMSDKQVRKVLDKAQHFRKQAVKASRANYKQYMKGSGPGSFAHRFAALAHANGYPADDVDNKELRQMVARAGGRDPAFGKREMTANDFDRIATAAIQSFYARKQAAFQEQHSGLATYIAGGHQDTPRPDARTFFTGLRAQLLPGTANGHPLSTEPQKFRDLALRSLAEIETTTTLIRKMAYDPEGWRQLDGELRDKFEKLAALSGQLQNMAGNDRPRGVEGRALQQSLVQEIRKQQDLIAAKLAFLNDLRQSDPLSKKNVAYSNLMWAHAAGHVIDQVIEDLRRQPVTNERNALIAHLNQAKQDVIQGAQQVYQRAPLDERTAVPGSVDKSEHPVVVGKAETRRFLEATLQGVGIPEDRIRELTSGKSLASARVKALNENQAWAPVQRDMLVHKGGVTRKYRSTITPGSRINARFQRRYLSNQPLAPGGPAHSPQRGVSAATKADHYHARNLKISSLGHVQANGTVRNMGTVVGHGVLDMWDIEDDAEREAANRRGAHEVLEAAISTNDRIRHEALNRAQINDNNPVKITHVSVNLITPSAPRDAAIGKDRRWVMPDHREAQYTDSQFEAFRANSTAGNNGNPVTFQVDDDRLAGALGQDVQIRADVDVISFSFGINPLATHKRSPDWIAGWTHVYDHNKVQMQKFIGDLGTGTQGAKYSAPGGFIGSVYDRLDPNDAAQAALRTRLQDQTDIVRQMFTSEDFKRGDGDAAKMGRHILALQALAEEALAEIGDTGQAATMSKGCKSDKDRGGVTDVELKHMMITEDMGGRVLPNEKLADEDLENYYVVSAASGQLENQTLNTGVPGSKEVGHMKERVPDPVVRQFLAGLAKFVAA